MGEEKPPEEVKPKHLRIEIVDDDNKVIDSVSSTTMDEYQCKYDDLYNILEHMKDDFWDRLTYACTDGKEGTATPKKVTIPLSELQDKEEPPTKGGEG